MQFASHAKAILELKDSWGHLGEPKSRIRVLACSWGDELISLSMLRKRPALEIADGLVPL